MTILLIYPYCLEARLQAEEVSVPPIGIFYVGAVLKANGYDVDILNWHNIHETPHLIRETLTARNPDIIGFSILHANRWGGIEIARMAKKINPDVKIVFGGIGATFFLSRLGLTFTHGDYALVEAIKGKDKIAERLFRRSLDYCPDHRAYLGLGIIKQQNRAPEDAVRVLSEGIERFPDSEPLNTCLGITYMNLRQYGKALSCFLKFQDSKEAVYYMVQCYEALGDHENRTASLKKLRSLHEGSV